MARLPGVRYLSAPSSLPRMSDGGEAIGQATQNLGRAIGQIADVSSAYSERLNKAKDAKATSAFFTDLDSKATDFENGLISRQDYGKWAQDWTANVDSWGSSIDSLDATEATKADIKIKYAEWAGAKRDRIATTAALKDVETTKGTIANNANYYARRGDSMGYGRTMEDAKASGIFRPDQVQNMEMEGERLMFEAQVDEMVFADPEAAEKFVLSDGFMANPGATSGLRDATLSRVREQKRVKSSDSIDLYRNDAASSQYSSVEDVTKKWEGKVSPSVLEQMQDDFRKRMDFAHKQRVASPEYQGEIAGEISTLLDGMVGADNYDDRYANVTFRIDEMSDSPLKRRYQEQIDAAKQGRAAMVKNAQDAAFAGLENLYKSGQLGSLPRNPQVMATDRAINDGFLKDKNKLLSLGYSDAQFNEIQKAENSSGKVTQQSQIEKFQQLWTQRENRSLRNKDGSMFYVPDGMTKATAEAILEGRGQIEYLSPAQTAQNARDAVNAERRKGIILQEMNTYLISNPKATEKEIEQKMFEIGGAEGRQAFQASKLNSFPSRSAGRGDRITSYGYSGDTTPDTNSTAGIGAWVSKDEQARIKRGEDTPNKLRAGDLAVSRDVERQFKAAGIQPGDTVTIELDDGSMKTGRWMDRTAEEYNGKALTGRFDLYSPDGPSPLNGRKVVGWMKAQQSQ